MKALLESADGLQKWGVVPDEMTEVITSIVPTVALYPPPFGESMVLDIRTRRYVLMEMREYRGERYGYFREEFD